MLNQLLTPFTSYILIVLNKSSILCIYRQINSIHSFLSYPYSDAGSNYCTPLHYHILSKLLSFEDRFYSNLSFYHRFLN